MQCELCGGQFEPGVTDTISWHEPACPERMRLELERLRFQEHLRRSHHRVFAWIIGIVLLLLLIRWLGS